MCSKQCSGFCKIGWEWVMPEKKKKKQQQVLTISHEILVTTKHFVIPMSNNGR